MITTSIALLTHTLVTHTHAKGGTTRLSPSTWPRQDTYTHTQMRENEGRETLMSTHTHQKRQMEAQSLMYSLHKPQPYTNGAMRKITRGGITHNTQKIGVTASFTGEAYTGDTAAKP